MCTASIASTGLNSTPSVLQTSPGLLRKFIQDREKSLHSFFLYFFKVFLILGGSRMRTASLDRGPSLTITLEQHSMSRCMLSAAVDVVTFTSMLQPQQLPCASASCLVASLTDSF